MKTNQKDRCSQNHIAINEDAKQIISSIEQKVVDLKCKLANLVIQQLHISQEIVLAEKAMIEKIKEAATANGVKPEDQGNWNFDTKKMLFTRR